MRIKLIFNFFLIFSLLSIINANWTTADIISYLNKDEYKSQNYFFLDPNDLLTEKDKKKNLDIYINEVFKKEVNLYYIILDNVDKSGLDNVSIANNYTYGSESKQSKSIFIITDKNKNSYTYSGEGINSTFTFSYLENIINSSTKHYTTYSYKCIRPIIVEIRNKLYIPDDGWTPSALKEHLSSYYKKNKTFGVFDVNHKLDFDELEKEYSLLFEDMKYNNSFFPFTIVVNEIYSDYQNKTTEFLNELTSEEKIKFLPDSIDKGKTVIFLFSENPKKKVDIYIGKEIPQFIEKEYIAFKDYSSKSDFDEAYLGAISFFIFYILGEKIGWTPELLMHQILYSTKTYINYIFLYNNFIINDTDNVRNYFEEVFVSIKDYAKIYPYILIMNKLSKDYEDLDTFKNKFITLKNPFDTPNSDLIYILMLLDNKNSISIYIGSKTEKYLNETELEEIIEKGQTYLNKNQTLMAGLEVIRGLRYYIYILPNYLTPEALSLLLNDRSNGNGHFTLDLANQLNEEELKLINNEALFNFEHNISTYIAIIDNYKEKYTYDLNTYIQDMQDYIIESLTTPMKDNITHTFIIVCSIQQNEISFAAGEKLESIKQNKEKIINSIILLDSLSEKIRTILKYTRLYGYLIPDNWSVEKINIYNKDWESDKLTSTIFDPIELINNNLMPTLRAYIKECESYGVNIFIFNVNEGLENKNINKNINNETFLQKLWNGLAIDASVSKDNCLFILYENDSYKYEKIVQIEEFDYIAGKNVKKNLTDYLFYCIIDDALDYFNDFGEKESIKWYEGFRKISFNFRNLFLENYSKSPQVFTPELLEGYINYNFPYTPILISDYFQILKEDEQNLLFVGSSTLKIEYNIHSYFYILNEVDEKYKKNIRQFGKELFPKIKDTKYNKKEMLLIVYFKENNLLFMYPGTNLSNYLTIQNCQDISENVAEEISKSKLWYTFAFLNLFSQINNAMKIKQYYAPDDIAKELQRLSRHLLFDKHNNLGRIKYSQLDKYLTNIEWQSHFVFCIIVSQYVESRAKKTREFDEYFNSVIEKIPLKDEIKNKHITYIMYCTSTEEMKIILKNSKVAQKTINNIINKGLEIIKEDSCGEGFSYILQTLNNNIIKKKVNIWIIITVVCVVILILIGVLLFVVKKRKKGGNIILETSKNYEKSIASLQQLD